LGSGPQPVLLLSVQSVSLLGSSLLIILYTLLYIMPFFVWAKSSFIILHSTIFNVFYESTFNTGLCCAFFEDIFSIKPHLANKTALQLTLNHFRKFKYTWDLCFKNAVLIFPFSMRRTFRYAHMHRQEFRVEHM
jgi:hypothetical protein